jgi:hypothetical protein
MVTEGIADARRVVAEGWDCLSDQTVVHLADAMEAAQARIAELTAAGGGTLGELPMALDDLLHQRKGLRAELATERAAREMAETDDYTAWMCWHGEGSRRGLQICNSNSEGAFRVYRGGQPAPWPVERILDPDYARIYTQARIIAWQYGWACLAHGSKSRDFDLLLVPWTDKSSDILTHLVARIADVCDLKIQGEPSQKPHDRKAWTLMLPGFSEVRWVDLSAFAPTEPTP